MTVVNDFASKAGVKPVAAAVLPAGAAIVPNSVPPSSVPPSSVPPSSDELRTSVPGQASRVQLEDAKGLEFRSWGDPHEVSGDGLKFDNMGIGYYTALKSASGDLMVTKRHEQVPGLGAVGSTVNTEAAVKVGDDVVKYDTKIDKLYINDQEVALKEGEVRNLPGGGKVEKHGNKISVTSPKGDVVTFVDQGKYMDLEGKIAASRKDGEVIGSLGRFDADTDASNDLVKPDGTRAASVDDFIKSWETPPEENLLTNPASKFVSPEAKEIAALEKENAELFKQEQAASDERRPLLADLAKNQSIYDALKNLPAEYLAEADHAFMKKFEENKAKVEALNEKIKGLNEKQAENSKKIDALKEILRLRGENALLYQKEQDISNERRPLLAEQAGMKDKGEFLGKLKETEPEKLAEADFKFLEKYQALLARILELGRLISSLNAEQKENDERIAQLDEIAHPGKQPVAFRQAGPAPKAA